MTPTFQKRRWRLNKIESHAWVSAKQRPTENWNASQTHRCRSDRARRSPGASTSGRWLRASWFLSLSLRFFAFEMGALLDLESAIGPGCDYLSA